MPTFYAHSGNLKDLSDWQLLRDHLTEVAKLAKERAVAACPSDSQLADAAYAAGLLHDLGKYRAEFQLHVRSLPVPRERTYHKQAGVAKADECRHLPVAFAIAGHHGGLPDRAELADLVKGPSGQSVATAVWPVATQDCPALATLALTPPARNDALAADLITRLLFSCLVDSDWTDTGAHDDRINGRSALPRPSPLDPAVRLQRLLEYICGRASSCKEPHIARVRDDILNACLSAAEKNPGLFSLTVPTGGGKTLSGLAFALKHAAAHGLRRIIYVASYLSILDQNARGP